MNTNFLSLKPLRFLRPLYYCQSKYSTISTAPYEELSNNERSWDIGSYFQLNVRFLCDHYPGLRQQLRTKSSSGYKRYYEELYRSAPRLQNITEVGAILGVYPATLLLLSPEDMLTFGGFYKYAKQSLRFDFSPSIRTKKDVEDEEEESTVEDISGMTDRFIRDRYSHVYKLAELTRVVENSVSDGHAIEFLVALLRVEQIFPWDVVKRALHLEAIVEQFSKSITRDTIKSVDLVYGSIVFVDYLQREMELDLHTGSVNVTMRHPDDLSLLQK